MLVCTGVWSGDRGNDYYVSQSDGEIQTTKRVPKDSYISKASGMYYLIKDTDDDVTESVTRANLKKYIESGVVISNIDLINEIPFVTDDSMVKTLIEMFKDKGSIALTKMIMLKKERDFRKEELTKLAVKLGLIPDNVKLTIDTDNFNVIFSWQNCIYNFNKKSGGSTIREIDVCDKSVVELSRLGFDAFNYMLLNIGTKAKPNWVNLHSCFEELQSFDSHFSENNIIYIGVTPSNKIFKVMIGYSVIYSVQFCNVEDLKKKVEKILGSKVSTDAFRQYVVDMCKYKNLSHVAVCKVSRKNYYADIDKLKSKYPTLQDVYILDR